MRDKERLRFNIRARNSERILEGGAIMDIECHDSIGTARLEHARNIFRRNWITTLTTLVLTGITKIGNDSGDPGCPRVLQRTDKEE